jgi:hypothetical protein
MVIYPELPEQISWPIIEKDWYILYTFINKTIDKLWFQKPIQTFFSLICSYVAFISGISMGGTVEGNEKTYLALNAFQRWINGEIVPSEEEV